MNSAGILMTSGTFSDSNATPKPSIKAIITIVISKYFPTPVKEKVFLQWLHLSLLGFICHINCQKDIACLLQ